MLLTTELENNQQLYTSWTHHSLTKMDSSARRPPTENQISTNPGSHVLITSHNEDGKAVIKATEPVKVRIG